MSQPKTVRHIAIDMQRLVAEQTSWHSPIVMDILPNVLKLCRAFTENTLYARFVAPNNIDDAHGSWKAFYHRWPMITGQQLDPALIELVAQLAALAKPDQVFDKLGYSVFSAPCLHPGLRQADVDTLILSGIETDVCVYSSALAAIDLGYFVVLASDALASPDEKAHRVVIDQLAPRLPDQIKVMTADEIIAVYGDSSSERTQPDREGLPPPPLALCDQSGTNYDQNGNGDEVILSNSPPDYVD